MRKCGATLLAPWLVLAVLGSSMTVAIAVSVVNDPVITGFDGQVFEFHSTGDYNLLQSGDWKVDATFLDPYNGKMNGEKSLTSSIQVTAPNGERVGCTLATLAEDAKLQMITTAVDGSTSAAVMAPASQKQAVKLSEMEAVLAPMDLPGLAQCTIHTPKFALIVTHVSGAEQAARFPSVEAWAAKFTWLDTNFELKSPLAPPVTGILDLLQATSVAAAGEANVARRRALHGKEAGTKYGFPMNAGVEIQFRDL
ncbi:hypothetical protein N2152v2_009929 [Parachlorella kessleri]